MTDLSLQDAVFEAVKEACKHYSVKIPKEKEWVPFNFYKQDKPYKTDDNDLDEENYIIVMVDDEDTDENGDWIVTLHIIASIYLDEDDAQGNLVLADLMNVIYMHLKKHPIIALQYEMEMEAHKRFNHECYPGFYECDLITKWKLPEIVPEGLEDMI